MANEEAADLRRTAVHEAGHAVVAEALTGAPAVIEIARHEKHGAVWHQGRCVHVMGTTPHAQQLIGLAGPIAEVLDSQLRHSTWQVIHHAILTRMSATDTLAAGAVWREDLDRAVGVAWNLWDAIEARATHEVYQFQQTERRRRGGVLLMT